jgi:hypothetical protein
MNKCMNTYRYRDHGLCYTLTVILSNQKNINSIHYEVELL